MSPFPHCPNQDNFQSCAGCNQIALWLGIPGFFFLVSGMLTQSSEQLFNSVHFPALALAPMEVSAVESLPYKAVAPCLPV